MGKALEQLRIAKNLKIEIKSGYADMEVSLENSDGSVEILGHGQFHVNKGDTVNVSFDYSDRQELLEKLFYKIETKLRVIRV